MSQPFEQNIITMIWDFDKTLIPSNMQDPLFAKYGVNASGFWEEVNGLEDKYRKIGIRVSKDTIYLNHFLTCVKQGIFQGLNNDVLRELGKELDFYEGLPEFFTNLKDNIEKDSEFNRFNIKVEHYVVSTGLVEMIKGSSIHDYVDGIWGCEFIEAPIQSKLIGDSHAESTKPTEISQIGYAIDNTSKTRALFEINKGSNKHVEIDVNASVSEENRRVPFENMIYIADGPSDVPVFSVLKKNGGKAFAVYPKGKMKEFDQVDQLRKDDRIDMYGEADYREGTLTYMWLKEQARRIAKNIHDQKSEAIRDSVSKPPTHINEE